MDIRKHRTLFLLGAFSSFWSSFTWPSPLTSGMRMRQTPGRTPRYRSRTWASFPVHGPVHRHRHEFCEGGRHLVYGR